MPPDVSIIIPICNRGELVRYTLESVRRASLNLAVQLIVVDDGSEPPAAESLARFEFQPEKIIRQPNRGLLFARLAGLDAADGRYVLFLDSDDLISREKLRLQITAMDATNADVSYTDTARCSLQGDYDDLTFVEDPPYAQAADAAEFYISIQPAPHSPIFRTDYLRRVVAEALFPPSPLYNCVAEIWFYYNAAPRPTRLVRLPGPHAIGGAHPGSRLTNYWERLGIASLAVMEAFARSCPDAPAAGRARQLVAEQAFISWRRLPLGFPREFAHRELQVWKRLRRGGDLRPLGGRFFQLLARGIGPATAARLLKPVQNRPYARVRTIGDAPLRELLAALPPP